MPRVGTMDGAEFYCELCGGEPVTVGYAPEPNLLRENERRPLRFDTAGVSEHLARVHGYREPLEVTVALPDVVHAWSVPEEA